jgi:hypothetical protein
MENTNNIKDLIQKFYPYAKNALGFEHPVRVIMRKDAENAENPLGKTAYYDPEQKLIVLYVINRHPKDVLRSFSHELVHHAQNCRGDLDDLTTAGHYAEDGKGREIEKEAYLQGNLNVRDWEDQKKFKGDNQMNEHYAIAKEEFKRLVAETVKAVLDEKKAKPDFLDLDKDGDKEEPMKKAAKDKKEMDEGEQVDEMYSTSQDEEHYAAQKLGAELVKKAQDKKKKVDEMDLEKEKEDAEVMDDMPALQESKQEEKQVVTETPQQPEEVKETNKAWYNTSLYDKLKSKWTK